MSQNIKSYIQYQLEQGVSKEQIYGELQKVGWTPVDVEIAYLKAVKAAKEVSGTKDSEAIASFTLGICSICYIPLLFPSLVGLVLGILSYNKTKHRSKVVWGIALSGFSLLLGILFWLILMVFALSDGYFSFYRLFSDFR